MYKKITYITDGKKEKNYTREYLKNMKDFCAKYDFDLTIIDIGEMNFLKRLFVRIKYQDLDKIPYVQYAGNVLFGRIDEVGLREFISWNQTDWYDNPLENNGEYIRNIKKGE